MVTGANGFTGQHLCVFLANQGFSVHAVSRGPSRLASHTGIIYHECELTNVSSVLKVVDTIQPRWIIHVAAMSKPDECDINREECLKQNVDATIHLGSAAQKVNARFIYFSTDFIFGENGPHKEEDRPNPLNFYGESKWKAEQWVRKQITDAVIVRPVLMYGPQHQNGRASFIQWVEQQLRQCKSIKVVNDQYRTPTYIIDICIGVQTIITENQSGIFHLAGPEIITPYNMAIEVAKVLSLDHSLIIPVDSSTFPEPVVRAKRSGLQIEKARNILNYKPRSFSEGVHLSFLVQ